MEPVVPVPNDEPPGRLLATGAEGLAAVVDAIGGAREEILLQTYIYADDDTGSRVRSALIEAAVRGVRVRVMVDSLGSYSLPGDYFDELQAAGAQCLRFNPLRPRHFVYRHHRKAVICDRQLAIVGGFNIADEYDGDGVANGWRDLGLAVRGELARELAVAFEALFERSLKSGGPPRLARLHRLGNRQRRAHSDCELLLNGPGRGANPLKAALLRDLGRADRVRIASPYFLPTWGLRRRLMKLARRGGRVQLVLPGQSDVAVARLASRSLYAPLLRAGVEVYEYQPQILHAKLVIADSAVYIGSANFNTRSLHIDYELLLRIKSLALRDQAEALFDDLIRHSRRFEADAWRAECGIWARWRHRLAYLLMARLDPLVARWLWRGRS